MNSFDGLNCPGAGAASDCYRKICLPQLPSAFVVRMTGPETEDGQIGQQAGDPMDLLDMGDLTLREPSRLLRTLWQQRQLAQAWSTFVVALLLRLLQWQSAVLTATITGVASSVTRLRSVWCQCRLQSRFYKLGTGTNRKLDCVHECEHAVGQRRCGIEPYSAGSDQEQLERRRGIYPFRFRSLGCFYRDRQHGVDSVYQHVTEYRRSERALLYVGNGWMWRRRRVRASWTHYCFFVAKRPIDGKMICTMTNIVALFELTFDDTNITKVCLKMDQ
ncbi:hypothetical protein DD238_002803 [Peronospora effusa]|uniref:Uncharacterized protein n=1 Tax=Peronospora effusa TaxID=542832 RepID=A0A3M6VSB7_9STRA|nr:hypothetical protein DD238_002803 [Peronospora effusa]